MIFSAKAFKLDENKKNNPNNIRIGIIV
jgi:hypothetical protein